MSVSVALANPAASVDVVDVVVRLAPATQAANAFWSMALLLRSSGTSVAAHTASSSETDALVAFGGAAGINAWGIWVKNQEERRRGGFLSLGETV